jgi:hypothetical protein
VTTYFIRAVISFLVVSGLVLAAVPASAQDRGIDAGGHLTVLRLSELDTTDVGIGVSVLRSVTPVWSI